MTLEARIVYLLSSVDQIIRGQSSAMYKVFKDRMDSQEVIENKTLKKIE